MQIQYLIFILDMLLLFCIAMIVDFGVNISIDISKFLDDFEVRKHMNNSIHGYHYE